MKKHLPSRNAKRFTVEEANAMLPLVRSIANDIRELFTRVTGRRSDLHRLLRTGSRGAGRQYDDEMAESRADLQEEYEQFWKLREELESLGVVLRQPEEGAIEFPAQVLGAEGYLSWHVGENEVCYYRLASAPQGSRKLLPALQKAK